MNVQLPHQAILPISLSDLCVPVVSPMPALSSVSAVFLRRESQAKCVGVRRIDCHLSVIKLLNLGQF